MNSLESVKELIEDYLEEASPLNDLFQMFLIIGKDKTENFSQKVYNAFYTLVANHTHTPEEIVCILETYTSELDGFSTNRPIQTLIAFACLESLIKRKLKVITGPWEKLLWIIVKYSAFPTKAQRIGSFSFTKAKTETVYWVIRFCSKELCPNPCLRLELFRIMKSCRYSDFINVKSFQENLIITLFELCENYKSLTVDQLPNFSAVDLQLVLQDNINMGYVMNDYDLYIKKSEIIVAFLTLTKMFALLEKEKQLLNHAYLFYDLNTQLSACLSFCGLTLAPEDDLDDDYNISYFIQVVSNDPLLMNLVIDTLDTITQVSLCFPENDGLQRDVRNTKGRMLHRFFKSHIKKLPNLHFLQEIHGGNAAAKEYRLRYIQNNMVDDGNNSDNDSASDENDGYRPVIDDDTDSASDESDGHRPVIDDDNDSASDENDGYRPVIDDENNSASDESDGYHPVIDDDNDSASDENDNRSHFANEIDFEEDILDDETTSNE